MQAPSTTRFSKRVQDYVKYRPGYPSEIIPFLRSEIGLSKQQTIAEIGSGTGLSAKLFLDNGNPVLGIEPNEEMRSASIELLKDYKNFRTIDGKAENTTLTDGSVDIISVGQAFHWFSIPETRKEFTRILSAEAWVILLWNERINNTPFLEAYDNFLVNNSTDYKEIDHRQVGTEKLSSFFGRSNYKLKLFSNYQIFDFEGLRGRYLSCSYAFSESDREYKNTMDDLNDLFKEYQREGKIKMDYTTNVYYGKLH